MSGRRKPGELSAEDRQLWERVTRSVEPLHAHFSISEREPEGADGARMEPAAKPHADALRHFVPQPPYRPRPQRHAHGHATIDAPTRRKLAKGRISIDATIDLHELDQARAHGLLLTFLQRSAAAGLRHVLVITGKGSSLGSEGILRRAVPEWLKTEPFRGLVGGIESAARHHGGGGAFYVKLRRKRDRR